MKRRLEQKKKEDHQRPVRLLWVGVGWGKYLAQKRIKTKWKRWGGGKKKITFDVKRESFLG